MKKREEINAIDIAVSTILFLSCLAAFFLVVEPLLTKQEGLMTLLKTGEKNIETLYWEVDRIPMLIDSDHPVKGKRVYAKLPFPVEPKNLMQENATTNGTHIFFFADLDKGENLLWIYHSDKASNDVLLKDRSGAEDLDGPGSGCDIRYGLPEKLRGLSLEALAKLDKITYEQAKMQWAFPLKKDFYLYIEHENGAQVIEKGMIFPDLHKTLVKDYGGWILFDDGRMDRARIRLEVG